MLTPSSKPRNGLTMWERRGEAMSLSCWWETRQILQTKGNLFLLWKWAASFKKHTNEVIDWCWRTVNADFLRPFSGSRGPSFFVDAKVVILFYFFKDTIIICLCKVHSWQLYCTTKVSTMWFTLLNKLCVFLLTSLSTAGKYLLKRVSGKPKNLM